MFFVVPEQKLYEYFIDANHITEAQIMGLGTRIFMVKEDDFLQDLTTLSNGPIF